MKCKLEENTRLFDVLSALRKGYSTGDFEGLFPYLAQDCVLESQWVLTPLCGYEEVVTYFSGKGKSIARDKCFPSCYIVELIGDCNPSGPAAVSMKGVVPHNPSFDEMNAAGKLCLLMEQTIDGETNGLLVDIQLNEEENVKRIDLCVPELFRFQGFYTYVSFFPTGDDWVEGENYHEEQEHQVLVSEPYYGALYLFLACAGDRFDEYDDLRIPMDNWCKALNFWNQFVDALSFDDAFETIAGIDYNKGTVRNPDAAVRVGSVGENLWKRRQETKTMLDNLMEWTEQIKDSYSYINSYGW